MKQLTLGTVIILLGLLSGCQTSSLPGKQPTSANSTSGSNATQPLIPTIQTAVNRAEGDSNYQSLEAHKAEAIALPLNVTSQKDRSATPIEFYQSSGHPTPSAAALAALSSCEQAREKNTNKTHPCELRKRNNQLIHNTWELTSGLTPDRPAFLWQIQTQDTRVYLAGSIHVLKPTIAPPPSYVEAFQQATTLVLEVDQRNQTPEQLQSLGQRFALLPQGTTLTQLLKPAEYANVLEYLSSLGADTTTANFLKPAMILLQAAILEYTSIGYLPQHGIESVFEAELGNRQLVGLETLEEQFAAATALPLELQAELLVETVAQADGTSEEISTLVHAWLSGDEDYLAGQFEDTTDSVAARQWLDDLLLKRNRVMAKGIDALLRGADERVSGAPAQTIFVLVGAAHLVGPDSVVELLEAQGYSLERLGYNTLNGLETN